MNKRKILERALAGSKNISFSDMIAAVGGWSMKDYHINIFYSADDEGYIADIPDLEACPAFGETPEKALKQVEIAKAAWLEAARAAGKSIPEPRYRPVIYPFAT